MLHFVFLQGMPSAFFSRVGDRLLAQDAKVTRINFCMGDWLFWHGNNTVNYRGTLGGWPDFFRAFCQREQVTDLVLLGEQRQYHRQAVEVSKAMGIRISVTDFGYLRPDWITLERDGMSGNSLFPRHPDEIRGLSAHALAAGSPEVDLRPEYADSATAMAVGDLLFSYANVLLWWLFPFYQRSDKRPHPLIYFPAIGWRLLRVRLGRYHSVNRAEQLIAAGDAPCFVLPLQLEHDFQIVAYSRFVELDEAIGEVLQSFARYAAPDARLIVKAHPWDPGLKNWHRRVMRLAGHFGVAERVIFLDGGSLDQLLARAAGMVTVNSTSGFSALLAGCPVCLLGEAVYDVSGLVHQDGLDTFWRHPTKPDASLVRDFIRALVATSQLRGVFFAEPGMGVAVEAMAQRLFNGSVGEIRYNAQNVL